jgi:hypothetical protein
MVEFASALVMVLVGALINGFMVCWLLRSVTLSNEPAFAAFCFTIAAALGSSERISRHDPGGSIAALGGLVGGGLGLWLFWRLAARPERAGQGEGH